MKNYLASVVNLLKRVSANFSESLKQKTQAWIKVATLVGVYMLMSNFRDISPLICALLAMTLIGRPIQETLGSLNFLTVLTDLFKSSPEDKTNDVKTDVVNKSDDN